MISFACISPHPPIILPSVYKMESKWKKRFISSPGSEKDRKQVKKTIENLELLGKKLAEAKPQSIIIASPHPDSGFNVPLFYLAKDFKGEIKTYLIGAEEPEHYFEEGKKIGREESSVKLALIASGDTSHCLKEDGPYGFNLQGPKFDKDLIETLKKKDFEKLFKLNNMYPEAGECGLRPICFILGILEASNVKYQPEVLSYEYPFGVGYLVVDFKLGQ